MRRNGSAKSAGRRWAATLSRSALRPSVVTRSRGASHAAADGVDGQPRSYFVAISVGPGTPAIRGVSEGLSEEREFYGPRARALPESAPRSSTADRRLATDGKRTAGAVESSMALPNPIEAPPRDDTARKRGLLAIAADHWSAGQVTGAEFARQAVRRRIANADADAERRTHREMCTQRWASPPRDTVVRVDERPPVW